MRKKILFTMFLAAFCSILLVSVLLLGELYSFFTSYISGKLEVESNYVATALNRESDPLQYLKTLDPPSTTTRITWVDSNGTVLFDSIADASTMENHLTRPEIAEALKNGSGKSTRYSETISARTIYYAMRLENGSVIRLSSTQKSIFGLIEGMVPAFMFGTVLALGAFALIAHQLTKTIVSPINMLNLEDPLSNEVYDELAPLLSRLSYQKKEIDMYIHYLREKQMEFDVFTKNMQEGLILLDNKAAILSINESAKAYFHASDADALGKNVLVLRRDLNLQESVKQALQGTPSIETLHIDGRDYQLLSNPVKENNSVTGAVLLLLDITEKHEAERMRKEFSANVSHELKTPLTSIIGYAEILKNGVAQPEDTVEFAARIYQESKRLLTLIDDIIKLSRLDEGDIVAEKQRVDLFALSHRVCERLLPLAEEKSVLLTIEGKNVFVDGIPHILEEMLYNLVDNGIKYNKRNGEVKLRISETNRQVVLSISDTGIGIPKKHQGKVFERFYRVDKSHSKMTGGTGLGLSIAKHAALYHGAYIDLQSTEGIGTTITVIFPKKNVLT